jgi:hypothetical protein
VWSDHTWSALSFQINDEHYFVYSFDSSGTLTAANFTATANGDLDCDGTFSTFQRIRLRRPAGHQGGVLAPWFGGLLRRERDRVST